MNPDSEVMKSMSIAASPQGSRCGKIARMPRLSKLVAGLVLAGCGFAAQANVYSFVDSNNFLYAELTTSGATDFSLAFLAAPSGSTAFIFNLELAISSLNPCGGSFSATSTGTQSAGSMTGTCDASGFVDAGKTFNWEIKFPTAGNPQSDRMEVGDIAQFSISPSDIGAWSITQLHINAYNANGDSIKLTGCTEGCTIPPGEVPEPATLSLLGLALLGLGAYRRKSE